MPQFARPDADTFLGNFQDNSGLTSNIFDRINEELAEDSDYIQSPFSPVNEVYVCRLSDVVDPISPTNHVMRMRTSVDPANQEAHNFTQELRQGYVNEGSPGTLIASQSRNGVTSSTWTTSEYTLSGAEAAQISDYSALFYRYVIHKP